MYRNNSESYTQSEGNLEDQLQFRTMKRLSKSTDLHYPLYIMRFIVSVAFPYWIWSGNECFCFVCFRKLSLSFKEGVLKSYLMTLFWHISSWNVILSWLRKKAGCAWALQLWVTQGHCYRTSVMHWFCQDAGESSSAFIHPVPEAWLSWEPWLALTCATLAGLYPCAANGPLPLASCPPPSCYFFLPLLCFSSFI